MWEEKNIVLFYCSVGYLINLITYCYAENVICCIDNVMTTVKGFKVDLEASRT